MKEAVTFYDRLGVAHDATFEEIKNAYRSKAARLHPDINRADDSDEQMALVNEAFTTLRHPARRAAYDRFLLRVSRRTIAAGTAAPCEVRDIVVPRRGRYRIGWHRSLPQAYQARRKSAPRDNIFARLFFAAGGSVLVGISVVMLMSNAGSDDARLSRLGHGRTAGGAVTARLAAYGDDDPRLFNDRETCREHTFSRVADNGTAVVTSDGTFYRGDPKILRNQSGSWRTGDRVIVCRSGPAASISNETSYAWLSARYDRTGEREAVSCERSAIMSVSEDGSDVQLADGNTYTIDPHNIAQYATTDWAAGHRVVLCRSGSAASIENLATAAKVQASYHPAAGAAPQPAGCATRVVKKVAGRGALVVLSDGRSYSVPDETPMRSESNRWRRGSRVLLCSSEYGHSIRHLSRERKVSVSVANAF